MSSVGINDLIGVGLKFPIEINDSGGVDLTTGFPLLKASIENIVAFVIGTRYFLGEFGINPVDLLEEPNDEITATLLEYRLQNQIPEWDKRVNVTDVTIERPSDHQVNVLVGIILNGTNIKETFVFPFLTSTVL